jgi:hypothetical protein
MATSLAPKNDQAFFQDRGFRDDPGLRDLRGVGSSIENNLRRLGV